MNPDPRSTSSGQGMFPNPQSAGGAPRMRDDSPERLAMTKDKIQDVGAQVRDKMSDFADSARASAENYIAQGRDFIRQNPAQGLLYALGAGFIVGWLLKR